MKVWVIAIETRKIIRIRVGSDEKRVVDRVRSVRAIRFICIPGKRPVKTPHRTPIVSAKTNSNNILYSIK